MSVVFRSIDQPTNLHGINNSTVSIEHKDTSTAFSAATACVIILRLALLSCSQSSQQARNDFVLCEEVEVYMATVELKVVRVHSTVTKAVEVESGHGGRDGAIL